MTRIRCMTTTTGAAKCNALAVIAISGIPPGAADRMARPESMNVILLTIKPVPAPIIITLIKIMEKLISNFLNWSFVILIKDNPNMIPNNICTKKVNIVED